MRIASDASRATRSPRPTCCARRSARRRTRSWWPRGRSSSGAAVEHGTPEEEGAGALVADRALRALRLQQVARRGLRPGRLQDRVPQGALPGGLPRGDALGRDRLDRRHREGHRRLRGDGDPGPAARHQRVARRTSRRSGARSASGSRRSRASARPRPRRSSPSGASGPSPRSRTSPIRMESHLVNKRTFDALIAAGAFDSLGTQPRDPGGAPPSACSARAARRREEAAQRPVEPLRRRGRRRPGSPGDDFPDLPEWSLDERLKGEKEVLGFYVTGHPLTRHRRGDRALRGRARSRSSPARVDQTVRVAGVLTQLKKQKIKKGVNEGKTMLKAVLEDTSGSVPVCIFASLYEKVRRLGRGRTCRCSSPRRCGSRAAAHRADDPGDRAARGNPRAAGAGDRDPGQPGARRRGRPRAPAQESLASSSRARRRSRSASSGRGSSRRA